MASAKGAGAQRNWELTLAKAPRSPSFFSRNPMKQPPTNRGVKPLLQLKIITLAQNPFPPSRALRDSILHSPAFPRANPLPANIQIEAFLIPNS